MTDEQDYIEMLERTQIPMDHPLIAYLRYEIFVENMIILEDNVDRQGGTT